MANTSERVEGNMPGSKRSKIGFIVTLLGFIIITLSLFSFIVWVGWTL